MKTIPIEKTTVDLTTGKNVTEPARAGLMPPAADACQVCGHRPAHPTDQPHNAKSLYYQYAFYGEQGRWPTWVDAIAHCPGDIRAKWEAALREQGAWPTETHRPGVLTERIDP